MRPGTAGHGPARLRGPQARKARKAGKGGKGGKGGKARKARKGGGVPWVTLANVLRLRQAR